MSNYYPLFSEIASLSYSLDIFSRFSFLIIYSSLTIVCTLYLHRACVVAPLSQYPLCPLCFRKVVTLRTKKSAMRSKKMRMTLN